MLYVIMVLGGRMGCLVEYVGLFVQVATLEDHDSLKEGRS